MNTVFKSPPATSNGAVIAEDLTSLEVIHRPDCAAAVWHRSPLPKFQTWLDALDPANLPRGRVILRPEAISATVGHLCDIAETPPGPERDMLWNDISVLAEEFAGSMGAPYLRLRLDVVSTNACRKFHIDAVRARLVCTYRGTGTQYGLSVNGEDPEDFSTVPTGSPIVLRGTLWPTTPPSGLLHRSPPIEGTGETRLLLVLDPIFDPDEEI